MNRYQSRNLLTLIALAISVTGLFVACERAKFGSNSGLPPLAQGNNGLSDDLDGGSEDTLVQCVDATTGENICLDTEIESIPVGSTFYIPKPSKVYPLASTGAGYQCVGNDFTDTKRKTKVAGIELWLVVDSSNSFDIERVAVAEAIVNGFREACRLGVPVRISVIAAHTPESPDSALRLDAGGAKGTPFFSQGGESRVIVLYPNMSEAELEGAKNDLLVKLDSEMRRDPITQNYVEQNPGSNGHSGADELGLLALRNTLKVATKRRDHALAVIMMSDENDICMSAFNNDQDGHENTMNKIYCDDTTPQAVYTELRNFAGNRPLVVSSIVYSGNRPFVDGGPNDIGRGYLDLAHLAGGRSFELAHLPGEDRTAYIHRMAKDVAKVTGRMTRRFTQYHAHYPVFGFQGKSIPLSDIRVNPETNRLDMRVLVDGKNTDYSLDPRYNLVTPANSGDKVVIQYCSEKVVLPTCGLPRCN